MDIQVQTLKTLVDAVDVAFERGAFTGPEASVVGNARDSVVVALQKIAQEQQTQTDNESKDLSVDDYEKTLKEEGADVD